MILIDLNKQVHIQIFLWKFIYLLCDDSDWSK